MEGPILKWTNIIEGWKERYVKISNSEIVFLKEKEKSDGKEIKTYNINTIKVINKERTEFSLIELNTKHEICLKAYSDIEKGKWISFIKNEQEKLKLGYKDRNRLIQIDLLKDKENPIDFLKNNLSFIQKELDFIENTRQSEGFTRIKQLIDESIRIISQISEERCLCKQNTHIIHDNSYENEDFSLISTKRTFENIKICKKFTIQENISLNSLISQYNQCSVRQSLTNQVKTSHSIINDNEILKSNQILPIDFHEPLTSLQRQAESFQFFSLLKKGEKEKKLEDKIVYIAAYFISGLSLTINRLLPSIPSLLGETYEYCDINNKFRCILEQISVNPSVSACLLESESIKILSSSRIDFDFLTQTQVLYYDDKVIVNEDYCSDDEKNDKSIYNFIYTSPEMILRNKAIDFKGTIRIEELKSKEDVYLELNFTEEGQFLGKVFKNKAVLYEIKGSWRSDFHLYDSKGRYLKEIWRVGFNEKYVNNKELYKDYLLSEYGYNLNNISKDIEECLPSTDSRRRKDLRLYEIGKTSEAGLIKRKYEENQRRRIEKYDEKKEIYKGKYFESVVDEYNRVLIILKDDYWSIRDRKSFIDEGIFDEDMI